MGVARRPAVEDTEHGSSNGMRSLTCGVRENENITTRSLSLRIRLSFSFERLLELVAVLSSSGLSSPTVNPLTKQSYNQQCQRVCFEK